MTEMEMLKELRNVVASIAGQAGGNRGKETACRREAQESCTRRLHAQAADHTQQHGEVRSALGSSNNYTLTHKTVALPPPFTVIRESD